MATDPLQSLIRSLPACFDGQGAADFTDNIANQAIAEANANAPSFWSAPLDWGEGSTIYSTDKVTTSANALKLYGQQLKSQGGTFCDASYEKNKLITMLGDVFGLLGAQSAVNARLQSVSVGLTGDLIDQTKDVLGDIASGVGEYTKWIVVGVVAVLLIILFFKFGGKT